MYEFDWASNKLWSVEREDDLADRKSTRLNSSHTVISYAVFCLKKKKKPYNRDDKIRLSYTSVGRTSIRNEDRDCYPPAFSRTSHVHTLSEYTLDCIDQQ